MRLKSFYAKNMKEALEMVRTTLGEEAIIIASREERGGKAVRVTAAIEEDFAPPAPETAAPAFEPQPQNTQQSGQEWLQYDEEQDSNAIGEELTDLLLRHAVPEEIIDHIVSSATVIGDSNLHTALTTGLDQLYHFRSLPHKRYARALMMVGPPGSGKTLAVAKLAARGVMNGMNMAVITTDTVRAGGIEQLAAFTRLMDIELLRAHDRKSLTAALKRCEYADQIVIDSPGTNPFQPGDVKDVARLLSAGDIEPVLGMPAGIDADEAGEIARVFATLGTRWMLSTRLDIARRLGGLLSAAHAGGLSFADASATPQVADGLTPLTARQLAQFLLPHGKSVDKAEDSPVREGQVSRRIKHG